MMLKRLAKLIQILVVIFLVSAQKYKKTNEFVAVTMTNASALKDTFSVFLEKTFSATLDPKYASKYATATAPYADKYRPYFTNTTTSTLS